MLSTLPRLAEATRLPLMAGGDFNLEPHQVQKTSFLSKAQLEVLAPSRGTCITNSWRAATTIDYFIVSAGLHQAVKAPVAMLKQGLAIHRPVEMSFVSSAEPNYFLALRLPPRLPLDGPAGPAPPADQHWRTTSSLIDTAISKAAQAARGDIPYRCARQAQDAAYHELAKSAEQELIDTLQLSTADQGKLTVAKAKRGQGPRYDKIQVSFSAAAQPPRPIPTTSILPRDRELVRFMLGHARQSIHTQAPTIDGMQAH